MSDPNTVRLVRQHAETSRLLGVDFVPLYTKRTSADAMQEPTPEAAPKPVPQHVPVFQGPATPAEPRVVEIKPPVKPKRKVGPKSTDREASQRLLDALRAKYEAEAPHESFVTEFNNIVFGEGDPCARLMFVGEAPGAEEDRTGRPFVGRAGTLLEKMINAMGLKRESVYIANVLKTRPIDNATPKPSEVEACAPFLWEQIRIISPEAIVTLGLPASQCLLKTTEAMGKLRATWATFTCTDGHEIPVMPTYHPAFLLRAYTSENRAKVWSDLQMVMDRLGIEAPKA